MAAQDDAFEVVWSEQNREAVRRLGKKAIRLGLKQEFLQTIEYISAKLANEPLTWGDPSYRLKNSGLAVFHGMHMLLHVFYGVHEDSRLVFVKEVLPVPGLGLDD